VHPLIPFFDHPKVTIPLPFELPLPFGGQPLTELTIYGFGVMVALGFLIGARISAKRADRFGLDGEKINQLIGWLVLGTFIGGHVGYGLMYKPQEYLADPRQFLKVWEGLSSFGGIVTCIAISIGFFWKNHLKVWPNLDCLAHGMALGWAFGRTGCTLAHDHPGAITNFWLGRQGICPSGTPDLACHDLGLYEALWAYTMAGILFLVDRKPRTPGFQVLLLGLCYGPVRFMFDFLRPASTDPRYWGLTPGQWWAMVFAAFCGVMMWRRLHSGDAPIGPVAPAPAAETPPVGAPPAV
jgi:phosphatidylglycerol---prolipoprotein diacylglyceryl transferase